MRIHLHKEDLEFPVDFGTSVAVDSESMGLNPKRDRLCLVQLFSQKGGCHLIQTTSYEAPRLKALLENQSVLKIFHYARADVYPLYYYVKAHVNPIFCTKIASRLARTYSDQHSLKILCKELIGVELSKEEQCSNWGAPFLSDAQKTYAAQDVIHLHALKDKLTELLNQENRFSLAQKCFDFLPTCALLDAQEFDMSRVLSY